MPAGLDRRRGVATGGFRWYTGSQAVSITGTMMYFTALYWLALHLARGNAVVLSVLVAAQFLPMLLFSRRAGPSCPVTSRRGWSSLPSPR